MGLKSYLARRIVYMIILVFLVATVNFVLFNLMPAMTLSKYVAKIDNPITEERLNQLKASYGLDKPFPERYVLYIRNMVTWNFVYSYETRNYVQDDILRVLPNTLVLMGIS